jgi:hypothetical protein
MKKLFLVLSLLLSLQVNAQIETPEECILNTLKSGQVSKDLASMVRYNCVQKYLKAVEPLVENLDVNLFSKSTASYSTGSFAMFRPHLEISLKNNSPNFTVTTAFVRIVNKKSGAGETYRLTVDSPILPSAMGLLIGEIPPVAKPDEFWKENSWEFTGVWGIPTYGKQ